MKSAVMLYSASLRCWPGPSVSLAHTWLLRRVRSSHWTKPQSFPMASSDVGSALKRARHNCADARSQGVEAVCSCVPRWVAGMQCFPWGVLKSAPISRAGGGDHPNRLREGPRPTPVPRRLTLQKPAGYSRASFLSPRRLCPGANRYKTSSSSTGKFSRGASEVSEISEMSCSAWLAGIPFKSAAYAGG